MVLVVAVVVMMVMNVSKVTFHARRCIHIACNHPTVPVQLWGGGVDSGDSGGGGSKGAVVGGSNDGDVGLVVAVVLLVVLAAVVVVMVMVTMVAAVWPLVMVALLVVVMVAVVLLFVVLLMVIMMMVCHSDGMYNWRWEAFLIVFVVTLLLLCGDSDVADTCDGSEDVYWRCSLIPSVRAVLWSNVLLCL